MINWSDETDRANLSFRSISIYFYSILPLTNENFNENATLERSVNVEKKIFQQRSKKKQKVCK